MKKSWIGLLVAIACFLSSCGSSTNDETVIFTNKCFTVTVPSGWFAIEDRDYLAEPDEKGDYPIQEDAVYIMKGSNSIQDITSEPYVYICCYDDAKAADKAATNILWYDQVDSIDVTIAGQETIAYQVKTQFSVDEDNTFIYEYKLVFYQIDEDHVIQYFIDIENLDDQEITADDSDVMKIMESVKINK